MSDRDRRRLPGPFAVILGSNEIASAVAVHLYREGFGVVLSHDPLPPVIRRKMSFHDALFGDPIAIEGVTALRADTGIEIRAGLERAPSVRITELGLLDLMVVSALHLLIDARMQKYQMTPDLRRLARFTIGLGPAFSAGENCDVAIETHPARVGLVIERGPTAPADHIASQLGARGAERFAYAAMPGRWHSAVEIGTRIFKDYIIGYLGNTALRAPFDGRLRGVVRDGTEVPAGVKLFEVDARGRDAGWTGIDGRGQGIAKAVVAAVMLQEAKVAAMATNLRHLVK